MNIKVIRKLNYVSLLGLLFYFGCENNIAEEQDDSSLDCSNVELFYTESIAPIMSQSCINCHSGVAPSGGLTLDSFSSVENSMASILDRVNLERGSSEFMPQDAEKLSDEELALLQSFYTMECE